MKKLSVTLLTALLAFTLAACTGNNNDTQNNGTSEPNQSEQPVQTTEVSGAPEQTDDQNQGQTENKDALGMLNDIWASYTDDEKFPAAGGDMSEENMNMEGPGKYSVED